MRVSDPGHVDAASHVRAALVSMEQRVRRERGQAPLTSAEIAEIRWLDTCPTCGHVECLSHPG